MLALVIPILYAFKGTTHLASYKPFIVILTIISITILVYVQIALIVLIAIANSIRRIIIGKKEN